MMFTVTYRSADGALRDKTIEAQGRSECADECKRQGIAPQSIREVRAASVRSGKKGYPAMWWVVGACLVLLAGCAWWFLSRGNVGGRHGISEHAMRKQQAGRTLQHPARPEDQAKATNVASRTACTNPNEEIYVDAKGVKRYKVGNGRIFDPDRPRRKMNILYDKDGKRRNRPRFAIFGNRAENEIASLIAMKPGTAIFGRRRYDAQFEEDFKESLNKPIEISETDSPREKALKQAMIEVKKEIAARMAKGEKLADILASARDELRRESAYRRQMQKHILDAADSGTMSSRDLQDYVDAANVMLKERGIAPIHASSFIRHAIEVERADERERTVNAVSASPKQGEGGER